MLRSLAVSPLLLLLMTTILNIDAMTIKVKIPTTIEPVEETTYMHLPDGTITVDMDTDEILTTSPESETFSEPSPLELTEEPLPESVIGQIKKEQEQEERAKEERAKDEQAKKEQTQKPINSEVITTEETTTKKKSIKKGYKFGATTSMPMGFSGFYTTTDNIEDTTEYEEYTTVRNFFKRPARPARLDLETAENRMETTTDTPVLQNKKQDYFTSPILIMTTDSAGSEPTLSPLFRFVTTASAKRLFMEPLPETTTMWPESKTEEATTMPVLMDSTEVPPYSSTQVTESITEPAETTTIPSSSNIATKGPEPLTAKMELYLNFHYPVSTSDPEITTVPETTIFSINDPETTTSTMSAPEITTLTTSAPEATTSTTSAPETTTSTSSAPEITTLTTRALETSRTPEATTSTTSAAETTASTFSALLATIPSIKAPETTTTTPRPVLTRAPRVERIFNSDGVEVLYGYSSVVRTNRS